MAIHVESTTDSPEAVTAAIGLAKTPANKEAASKDDSAGKEQAENESSSAADDTDEKVPASEKAKDDSEGDGSDDDGDSDGEGDQAAEKPKRKNGYKRKISGLEKRMAEKDREIEFLRAQALKGQPPQERPAPKTDQNAEPKVDDFETHAEYVKALTRWQVDQATAQANEQRRIESAKQTIHEKKLGFAKKAQEFAKATPDFDDVVEAVDDIIVSPAVQELLFKNGPELAYALMKDPEEFARINALHPLDAAEEIGIVKARIKKAASAEVKEPKTSQAPPPVKPVGSARTSGVKKSIYDPNISQAEYERLRSEQRAQRAAAR